MIKTLLVVMGSGIAGVMSMQLIAFWRRGKEKDKIIYGVSESDAQKYEGKHVMTDGYGGPVVGSGGTFEEMLADVAHMDADVLDRLVHVYIPKKGAKLIGGRYFCSAR